MDSSGHPIGKVRVGRDGVGRADQAASRPRAAKDGPDDAIEAPGRASPVNLWLSIGLLALGALAAVALLMWLL